MRAKGESAHHGLRTDLTPGEKRKPSRRGFDLRLAIVAGGAWTGVLAGLSTSGATHIWWVLLAAGTSGISFLLKRSFGRLSLASALVFTVGLMVGGAAQTIFAADPLVIAAGKGGYVETSGTVVSDPKRSEVSWKKETYSIKLQSPSSAQVWVEVSDTLRSAAQLGRGSELQVGGVLKSADNVRPPAVGFMRAQKIVVLRAPPAWQSAVTRLKEELASIVQTHGGTYGALISGMALGDDRGLPKDVKEAMLTTSLTHLTAISGSHIAISLAVLRFALPGHRRLRAAFTGIFLLSILLVVGPTPSVVRAVLMGAIAVWGLLLRRPGQPLNVLFAVTAATVLVNPWSALSLGFALSTVATAGIITLGRYFLNLARDALPESFPFKRFAEAAIDATAIAVSAQMVTLPILALANPWLPTWGVVANLLVAPVVAPLTLLGLSAALTCLWLPSFAGLAAAVARPLATCLAQVSLWVADWPLARLPWPEGSAGFMLAGIATVACGWAIMALLKTLQLMPADAAADLKSLDLWRRLLAAAPRGKTTENG